MGLCYKCSMLVAFLAIFLAVGPLIYYQIDTREYNRRTTAEEAVLPNNLRGQIAIVTGSSSGIGIPTAQTLYAHGATVVMACRNLKKANKVRDEILSNTAGRGLSPKQLQVMQLDLSSLQSVTDFVKEFKGTYDALNILINNAAIAANDEFTLSTDGIELQFAVNHIGHFALSNQLSALLAESASKQRVSRVINVASAGYMFAPLELKPWFVSKQKIQDPAEYIPFPRYGFTKAANIIFSKEFNKRFRGRNVYSVSVHPGTIKTGLQKYNYWLNLANQIAETYIPEALLGAYLKSLSQGAATTIRVAAMPQEDLIENGGRYFEDCNVANMVRSDIIDDGDNSDELGTLLWDLSERMVTESGFSLK